MLKWNKGRQALVLVSLLVAALAILAVAHIDILYAAPIVASYTLALGGLVLGRPTGLWAPSAAERAKLLRADPVLREFAQARREPVAGEAEEVRARLVAAEESSRAANAALGVVSHELRTPLAAVRGFASIILDYGDRLGEEEKLSYVQAIDDAARHLERMVSDLLTISRLDAGAVPLDLAPIDVAGLMGTVTSGFGVGENKHEIITFLPDDPLFVEGDMSRLRQVLTNLVDNAVKYAPDSGPIEVQARQAGAVVEISVRDYGRGVPPDALESIFDRFYRVRSPETTGVRGSGLGLAICRGLVAAHGGRIWAELPADGGLRVSFSLPRVIVPELRASA